MFDCSLMRLARSVRANGSRATAPTGRPESEVDRLVACVPGSSVTVTRSDRELVSWLQEFTADR